MFPVAMWNHQRVPQTSPTSPPPNIPRNARQSGEIRGDDTHLRPQHNWLQLPPRVRKNHGFTADLHNIVFSEHVPWNLWQTAFVELVSCVCFLQERRGTYWTYPFGNQTWPWTISYLAQGFPQLKCHTWHDPTNWGGLLPERAQH